MESKLFSDGVHLISNESLEHLHKYCSKIGIKRCWFHKGSRWPHYDIPKKKRADFFANHPEVVKVTAREIVAILQNTYKK